MPQALSQPAKSASFPPQRPRNPLDLVADYPACFDLANPRPIKLRINEDLVARNLTRVALPDNATKAQREANRRYIWRRVRWALMEYCTSSAYLAAMVPGAIRIDLDGQPAGVVTESEALYAATVLRGETPPARPVRAVAVPDLPEDAPLQPESIVPGNLEITVKFSQLPKAVTLKTGMKIAIKTDAALVVAILSPKTWKKLVKAANEWPQWTAILNGHLGATVKTDAGTAISLEPLGLQVFEKKAKPAAVVSEAG